MKSLFALTFALSVALASTVSAAGKGPTSKTDLSQDAVPVATADSTSLACYFQKGDDVKWYWGLTSDSGWYALPGEWKKTQYTKLQKFFSSASQSSITSACNNSATYYGLVGYTLMAAFAADKGAGFSYPIVVGGNTELYPQY